MDVATDKPAVMHSELVSIKSNVFLFASAALLLTQTATHCTVAQHPTPRTAMQTDGPPSIQCIGKQVGYGVGGEERVNTPAPCVHHTLLQTGDALTVRSRSSETCQRSVCLCMEIREVYVCWPLS